MYLLEYLLLRVAVLRLQHVLPKPFPLGKCDLLVPIHIDLALTLGLH